MATTPSGASGSSTSRGKGTGMQTGRSMSGGQAFDDPTYDLISVMYHALQGCETYERYANDAEQAGQHDVAQFFREAQQENERRAQRGRQLLAQCLQQGQGGRSGQQLSSQNVGTPGQQGTTSTGTRGSGSI